MMNKQQTHITGSFQSAAKLIALLILIGSAITGPAMAASPFAPIVGTWKAHMSTGQDRVYAIEESGAVTFENPGEFKRGTLTVMNGEFIADFGDRFVLFYRVEDDLKIEAFFPKSRFAKREPNATGTGHREQSSPSTPAPVTPRQTVVAKSTPAPVANPAVTPSDKKIQLKPGWDSPMQGGSKTHHDLAFVLNGFAKPNPNPASTDIEIFNGVRYLMPLSEAVAALGLNQRLPAAKKVVCPGLPKDSLNYISFDGLFDGHYNRLDLVTDTANQVVCVQLVDEHPKETAPVFGTEGDWLTYNFIGYRVKAMSYMKIEYVAWFFQNKDQRWSNAKDNYVAAELAKADLLRVDAVLTNKERKRLEETRWFVPKSLAELILHCIGKAQR